MCGLKIDILLFWCKYVFLGLSVCGEREREREREAWALIELPMQKTWVIPITSYSVCGCLVHGTRALSGGLQWCFVCLCIIMF
jgi:hypothetical protein